MTLNLKWANGTQHLCRCGQIGAWFWEPAHETFRVEHVTKGTPCYLSDISPNELKNLRKSANKLVSDGSRQMRYQKY